MTFSVFVQGKFKLKSISLQVFTSCRLVPISYEFCFARYLQRCPIPLLKSELIPPLIECATLGTELDHREANVSVMKFLYDMAHAGRRHKENPDFPERQSLVKNILNQNAPRLVHAVVYNVIFKLPSYTIGDIAELIYEIKEVMPEVRKQKKWT